MAGVAATGRPARSGLVRARHRSGAGLFLHPHCQSDLDDASIMSGIDTLGPVGGTRAVLSRLFRFLEPSGTSLDEATGRACYPLRSLRRQPHREHEVANGVGMKVGLRLALQDLW